MNDLISRHALCEYALNQKDKSITPNDIMRFPSAQPKQKVGWWIKEDRGHVEYTGICSKCGFDWGWYDTQKYFNFCPNCGEPKKTKETDYDYERAVEQLEHDMLYEPTFNHCDGSI